MADTYQTLVIGSEVSSASGGLGTAVADLATVAANVATLVADGASPTQAHVTTLNTNFGTFQTAFTAFTGTAATAALLVVIDTKVIGTVSVLRAMFNQALLNAASQGMPQ